MPKPNCPEGTLTGPQFEILQILSAQLVKTQFSGLLSRNRLTLNLKLNLVPSL